jgi:hypothetical protein
MTHSTIELVDTPDPEAVFRSSMAVATNALWDLGYDEEALSSLHDVIEQATIQREAGENRHDDLSQ